MRNKITLPFNDRDGVYVRLDECPWEQEFYYKPTTTVWLAIYDEAIHVGFCSAERPLKCTVTKHYEYVYKDSCCEFFLMPFPNKDKRYLNFEINACGTLYLGCGKDREDSDRYFTDPKRFRIVTHTEGNGRWSLAFSIPFDFIKEVYGAVPKEGDVMRANLYKCGNDDTLSHYLTCFPIGVAAPDFHRPEYFGEIELI